MGALIYSALTSLDGYVADEDGKFDWAEPDEEVHALVNDLTRPVGIYLLGRRMYDVLVAWETLDTADEPPCIKDFAEIWRAADKIVYSKTLDAASSARTRIEHEFDPDAVRKLKSEASRDLTVGGPNLAAQAFESGLVDECHLVPGPDRGRRGQSGAPGRRPPRTRVAGRTPVRQRHGASPLPHARALAKTALGPGP
jgi:dihydrofolate reductase